jgi:hypothetical protein
MASKITRSRKWMPSIITTGRSNSPSGRASHCASCSWLSSTKRRDTALLDAALGWWAGGTGSCVLA